MSKCEHLNFKAKVEVNRLLNDEGIVHGYSADIRIECDECSMPFEFVGAPAGWSIEKPMCNVTAQELHAPIRPKGSLLMPAIPGFTVRMQ